MRNHRRELDEKPGSDATPGQRLAIVGKRSVPVHQSLSPAGRGARSDPRHDCKRLGRGQAGFVDVYVTDNVV